MKMPDESIDIKIATVLRVGVISAGVLIFLGWLSQISLSDLARRSDSAFDGFKVYESSPLIPVLQELVSRGRWGELVSYLGLSLLILLPVFRVFMTFVSFLIVRDFMLSLLSAIVFISLLISFSLGLS